MPLTPEDVRKKRFTPVRLREGYDMGEVDQFLDEVEAELERLLEQSEELRVELAAATGDAPPAPSTQAMAEKPAASATEKPTEISPETPADRPPDGPAPAEAPPETIKVVTPAEASSAALRLLELATRSADEVVAEAREEAQQIVVTARTEAERLDSETRAKTDALEREARSRAQNLDSETATRRGELLGDMEQEKARLDGEVDNLRAFEREYRSRLKSYFSEQLQALDGVGEGGEPADSGDSKRLRSVLGEPGDHESVGESPSQDQSPDGRGDESRG